jgi:protein CWC15
VEELKKKQMEEILRGNPLLNQDEANEISETYSLKRKWYEESIFKNQARTEPKEKKRFVNDTVRSDFHRKFLNRFI